MTELTTSTTPPAAAARRGEPRAGLRRLAAAAESSAIAVVGLLGLLALLATLAPLAGFRLVRLETGSMAPTYPTGSVLLVRDAPAAELRLGDVVTVRRAGASPVTHRVVGLEPAGEGVALTLRGDANATDDPRPYLVTRVGLVVGGVPFGGQFLEGLRSAPAMIGLSALASAIVLRAWWPTRRRREETRR